MKKLILKLTGGKFNRRSIVSYSSKTKPSSQLVREAVFNSLGPLKGVALDLFAGSGAYGFEALSRGASFVYFNDSDYNSIRSLKENAASLVVSDKIIITQLDYQKALDYYFSKAIFFDYCFIDPPYEFSDSIIEEILVQLLANQKKGLKIVLERKRLTNSFDLPGLKLLKTGKYGAKSIFIYQIVA